MPRKKNLTAIHPLVVRLCELVDANKQLIKYHLNRQNQGLSSQNHQYID